MDAAHAIAIVALLFSLMSLLAAVHANRAAIYGHRLVVYSDAQLFLTAWMQDGRPDMQHLRVLVQAWSASHFLFSRTVTAFLRQLWLDAIDANMASRIATGELPGDHQEAVRKQYDLMRKYFRDDEDVLRNVFAPEMRVTDGLIWPLSLLTRR